ncbi:ribosomal RNA large subunit methyltransferase E [Buchnera aphidicola (Nipponaphis monzeni)]|uniref:Ribosomal RNA large subunit methyltransferase E n=1 Tax=Buchnera aphidicola (Nipponaphis monzeni) TaxID=2495405 RepID=A0A455TAC6_9GAMM|nr:SAM-dependent methyltransferase [Buchnera aphidicola]BBI01301.1 ribosomal RNA large subunit methyltransferase E [Buchnera aphidicola (Nipponaphis monzeni)]
MSQKKSSHIWIREHQKDIYVKQALLKKLRSRAWFKLKELDQRDNLIKKKMCILDLGSSPGSWSKYAVKKINYRNKVIACDIRPMKFIPGVNFVQGDIQNKHFLNTFIKYLNSKKINLIMSDMAPNISGNSYIDTALSIKLAQLAFFICQSVLIYQGDFIVKVFQGDNLNEYLQIIKNFFLKVKIRKPNSSKTRSKELYIVAKGWIKKNFSLLSF